MILIVGDSNVAEVIVEIEVEAEIDIVTQIEDEISTELEIQIEITVIIILVIVGLPYSIKTMEHRTTLSMPIRDIFMTLLLTFIMNHEPNCIIRM